MGLEDFGVILRPTQPLSASSVERSLLSHGFAASSRAALPQESSYVLNDNAKNIEARLTRDTGNSALMSRVSIRYAVCQPEAATEAFLKIVTQVAEEFCLQITGLAPGVEFSCATLSEFQKYAREKVAKAKSRWSGLFAGDTEEVVLSVSESWKYFLAKHPEALRREHVTVK